MRNYILFVSHSADTIGPTNSLLFLLKELGQHQDVAVLLPGQGSFAETLAAEGFRVFCLPSLTKRSLPAIVRLMRRERFDLVYANNTSSCARIAFLAARLAGMPFISHVRAMEWDKSWSRLGYLWFADAVIAVSNACGNSVRRFVRSGRLHVVYNGVPPAVLGNGLEKRQGRLRGELWLDKGAFVVLGVAHITPRKAQEHAVRSMTHILPALPSAHLCLVGSLTRDPAYLEKLRTLASSAGIGAHVHMLGLRLDVFDLLRDADIFMHTAIADPHPRSVIEAMAAGLPVVAFATDGVAETVVDGETGILVQPNDPESLAAAVLTLAQRPDVARRMGEAARRRVRSEFSAHATAEQVGRVITDVISKRNGCGKSD